MRSKSSSVSSYRLRSKVAIGIPVYNSGELLRECLEDVLAQTYEDFQVLIYDNASTDDTGEIALEFAENDPRIRYARQPENKGAVQNFVDVLNASDAEYFMWHADDDRLSPNFLETMVELLDDNPDAELAVGHVESRQLEKSRVEQFRFPDRSTQSVFLNVCRNLYRSHASWIYGLWRTGIVTERANKVWVQHSEITALDHLTLLPSILADSVVGDNSARFFQFRLERRAAPTIANVRSGGRAASVGKKERLRAQIKKKYRDRQSVRPICDQIVRSSRWEGMRLLLLRGLVVHYADIRAHATFRKITTLRFRTLFS